MKRPLLLPAIILCMLTPAAPGAGPERNLRRELESLRSRINRVNRRLENIDAARQPILAELARIDLSVQREQLGIQRIEVEQRQLQERITDNRRHRDRLQNELAGVQSRVRRVARYIYKLGGQSYLKLFLRVDSLEQLFRNYHLFMILIHHHLDQIRQVRQKTQELQQVNRDLAGQEKALDSRKREHRDTLGRLASLRVEQKRAEERINRDRNAYLRLLEELRTRAGELEDLIHRAGGTETATPIQHLSALRGRLPWPLNGRVKTHFGRQRSTRFNTYIMNDGIEIQPGKDRLIHAIYPGKVIFADYFKGYGNLLILQHAKNFHSLYGHCARFLRKKGDRIRSGEVIAVAGDSGSTSGPSLYFAIRTDLKPRDPLQWLVRK